MTGFLWFLSGFAAAFLVSFGALVGWWIIITRHNPKSADDIHRDFGTVREAIRKANARAN